jgi:hypothetical protein
MDDTQALRLRYRPGRVRTLFVGESAPVEGRFFYDGRNLMLSHFKRAFGRAGENDAAFLTWFRSAGMLLDDLSHAPVNGLPNAERAAACKAAVPELAARIRAYDPEAIVCVMRSRGIEGYVSEAVTISGTRAQFHTTAFPGCGQQNKFVADIARLRPLPGES